MLLSPEQAAAEKLLWRRSLRENLVVWAEHYANERNYTLAKHHRYLLDKLQAATDGTLIHSKTGKPVRNLIVSMPPGSAKSFYTSVVFPVWFMQRRKGCRVLACSHSADLIESFSRDCRNAVLAHHKSLGYTLRSDSRAVQEWMTTNDGAYRCAGVGAGIAGRRADVGVIDDYIGSQEDADSKLMRDKVWAWYLSDFWPRLKPNSLQVIVATRWHEEDLIGRLTDPKNTYNSPIEPDDWEEVKFPFFAEQNDVLERAVGDRIWPEWFTEKMAEGVNRLPPRVRAGLYQQRPAPDEGIFFKKEDILGYTLDDLQALERLKPRIYGAGDWAVSEEEDANRTCFGSVARADNGDIFFLPDLFWKQSNPKEVCKAFVAMCKRRNPLQFWSEKGHISKSWGPFLREMMNEEQTYNYITEVTVSRAKDVRAQSIRGMMQMGKVRFPFFAPWWADALHELLTFPGGKTDDFVDFIAHIGLGINSIIKTLGPAPKVIEDINTYKPITLAWVKKSHQDRLRNAQPVYQGR